jgi:hypothetical protein
LEILPWRQAKWPIKHKLGYSSFQRVAW